MITYKAVRLDRTSHYDKETKWRVGAVVKVDNPDPAKTVCGRGIHTSLHLLDVIGFQLGPSRYYKCEPLDVIATDELKMRSSAVRVISEIGKREQDEIAGFKLWEINHPVNPFTLNPKRIDNLSTLVSQWDLVWHSISLSLWPSIGGTIQTGVHKTTMRSLYTPMVCLVGDSIEYFDMKPSKRYSVLTSIEAAIYGYISGLFPRIRLWRHAEVLGPYPWKSLLTMWHSGYVPSFDGEVWRVHTGPKARIVETYTVEDLRKQPKTMEAK